jgi:nucleotide-binding universal stress UspA family protein
MISLKKILVPTDFGEAADAALAYARALARNFDASIDLVHVVEDAAARMYAGEVFIAVPPTLQKDIEDAARRELAPRLIDNDPDPLQVRPVVLTSNAPALTIVQYAKEMAIDLIVMGTHGRSGFERLALGSVTEKILRKATCPVLAVPPGDQHPAERPFRTLLCPTDFSQAGDAAVAYARFIARLGGTTTLLLMNVVEWPFGHTSGDDAVTGLRLSLEADARDQLHRLTQAEPDSGLNIQAVAASGNPGRDIVDAARARLADLIVMGVTGRGAIDLALLGSTTYRVVRHAPCPVLTVPQTG